MEQPPLLVVQFAHRLCKTWYLHLELTMKLKVSSRVLTSRVNRTIQRNLRQRPVSKWASFLTHMVSRCNTVSSVCILYLWLNCLLNQSLFVMIH